MRSHGGFLVRTDREQDANGYHDEPAPTREHRLGGYHSGGEREWRQIWVWEQCNERRVTGNEIPSLPNTTRARTRRRAKQSIAGGSRRWEEARGGEDSEKYGSVGIPSRRRLPLRPPRRRPRPKQGGTYAVRLDSDCTKERRSASSAPADQQTQRMRPCLPRDKPGQLSRCGLPAGSHLTPRVQIYPDKRGQLASVEGLIAWESFGDQTTHGLLARRANGAAWHAYFSVASLPRPAVGRIIGP